LTAAVGSAGADLGNAAARSGSHAEDGLGNQCGATAWSQAEG